MTKSELKQYSQLTYEIEDIQKKIEETREQMYCVKSQIISDMPKGGARVDLTSEQLDLLKTLESNLSIKKTNKCSLKIRIESAIDALQPLESRIMRLYYIDGLSWGQVASKVNYTARQVTRIHSKALYKLKDVL